MPRPLPGPLVAEPPAPPICAPCTQAPQPDPAPACAPPLACPSAAGTSVPHPAACPDQTAPAPPEPVPADPRDGRNGPASAEPGPLAPPRDHIPAPAAGRHRHRPPASAAWRLPHAAPPAGWPSRPPAPASAPQGCRAQTSPSCQTAPYRQADHSTGASRQARPVHAGASPRYRGAPPPADHQARCHRTGADAGAGC